MRGLPNFKKEVFHLKGGNQLLPDTFAAKLGERVMQYGLPAAAVIGAAAPTASRRA